MHHQLIDDEKSTWVLYKVIRDGKQSHTTQAYHVPAGQGLTVSKLLECCNERANADTRPLCDGGIYDTVVETRGRKRVVLCVQSTCHHILEQPLIVESRGTRPYTCDDCLKLFV